MVNFNAKEKLSPASIKKIIITNNLPFLKQQLDNKKEKIAYFCLNQNNESNKLRNYFSSLQNTYEIDSREFYMQKDFAKEYSTFIYKLNKKNASKLWWSLSFTNKHTYITPFCQNIYDSLNIIKLIDKGLKSNLVIVCSNISVGKYVRYWAHKKGIDVSLCISHEYNLKSILYNIPTFFVFYTFLKVLLRKAMLRILLKNFFTPSKKDYIIITQFENISFRDNGTFRDVYFGRLGEFFEKENKSFITCGIMSYSIKKILRRKKRHNQQETVYPLEHFVSFNNLLKCLKEIVFNYSKKYLINNRDVIIYGEDVLWLLENEIDYAYGTGQVFVNLLVYYCVKDLLKQIHARKIFYPFENRSWEKMILLATRETSIRTELVGYQHASLTNKHINFLLENKESSEIPFPDEIVTMGYVTRDIMSGLFNFPKDKLKVGCALREALPQLKKLRPKIEKVKRLLVALSLGVDEHVKMLKFLDSAFCNFQPYRLTMRAHPTVGFTRFEQALKIYKPHNIKYEYDNSPLYDTLKISDIVIYRASTFPLYALYFGVPVIYLDFGDVLNYDPLFNLSFMRWICKDPNELKNIIKNISEIDEPSFLNMQEQGREFAERYCVPSTENNMKVFI